MIRLVTLFIFFPLFVLAQSPAAMQLRHIRELKIQSVTCYDSAGGETGLRERRTFDTLGHPTSRVLRHSHHDTVEYKRDTILYYVDRIVLITNSKRRDSTVTYLPSGADSSRRMSIDYSGGKIIEMRYMTGDSVRGAYITESYRSDTLLWRNIQKYSYTYDKQGRVVSYTISDSTYHTLLPPHVKSQSYEIVYAGDVVTRSDYKYNQGKRALYRRTYQFITRNTDSALSYDEQEKVKSITVSHYDSLNRTVESIYMNKHRKISYRVISEYQQDSIRHWNIDGKDRLHTWQVIFLDKNGLIMRETTDGTEGRYGVWYEYTFYDH